MQLGDALDAAGAAAALSGMVRHASPGQRDHVMFAVFAVMFNAAVLSIVGRHIF